MSSSLFALDYRGRVHQLSTDGGHWKELLYQSIDFKRISSCQHTLWAVGADNQIYAYFYGSDAPIRREVETYENQRWNPIGGFCNKLLPTDRHGFSSKDGLEERTFNSFSLPSLGWTWEDDWHVSTGGDDGSSSSSSPADWQYAVDFPATYYPDRFFSACVRRRRWCRHQRYVAVRAWSSVPADDEMRDDPVVDLSVGGQDLAGSDPGSVLVWVVTANGLLYVRHGVKGRMPTGLGWRQVTTPACTGHVCHVSCSDSGLVWLLCWDGSALVRTGVNRQQPQGDVWCSVQPPSGVELRQLSVGSDGVWALASDGRVFFRKDVQSQGMSSSQLLCTGSAWLEMFSSMKLLSVGLNNQVFGIGTDRQVYMRANVSSVELTGRDWRAITAPAAKHPGVRAAPANSSPSEHSSDKGATSDVSAVESDIAGFEPRLYSSGQDDATQFPGVFGVCDGVSRPVNHHFIDLAAGGCSVAANHKLSWFDQPPSPAPSCELWHQQLLQSLQSRSISMLPFKDYEAAVERGTWLKSDKCHWMSISSGPTVRALLELEVHGPGKQNVESACISIYTHGNCRLRLSVNEVTCVMNISPSSRLPTMCVFSLLRHQRPLLVRFSDEATLLDWMQSISDACDRLRSVPDMIGGPGCLWACNSRGDVFCASQQPTDSEKSLLETVDCMRGGNYILADNLSCDGSVVRFLEHGFPVGSRLVITYRRPETSKRFSVNFQAGCSNADCTDTNVSIPLTKPDIIFHFNPRFAEKVVVMNASLGPDGWGNEQRLTSSSSILNELTGDIDIICQQDYFKVLCAGECVLFDHRADAARISHVVIRGEVDILLMTYQPKQLATLPRNLYWRHVPGHLSRVESGAGGQVWGLGFDGNPWLYMARTVNSETGAKYQITDVRSYYTYENQRWNPVSGFTKRGLPTDRPSWSDKSGLVECLKEWVTPPSSQWHWISDWMVDYSSSDEVDDNGWQYAVDFPASYHGYRGIQDFVRRRRWVRKCQLLCDSPWRQAANLRLQDISLSMELLGNCVAVWAVTLDGQLVHALSPCHPPSSATPSSASVADISGVHADFEPGSLCWSSVSTDQPVRAVSCGTAGSVWVLTESGSARVRFGVNRTSPTGTGWVHVAPPVGCSLSRVSVGFRSVWSIDSLHRLYVRCEVSSVCPEGTAWRHVASDVWHVSCSSPSDEDNHVWIACRSSCSPEGGGVDNVVTQRVGVCDESPSGSHWHHTVMGNWTYISCRSVRGISSSSPLQISN